MNQEKFKEGVNSNFKKSFIDYMNDVEAYYLEIENEPYSKKIEDNIKEFRHAYNTKIQASLRLYLNEVKSLEDSDIQKELARETLYSFESDFHADGVKVEITILNRFKKAKE